MSAPRLLHCTTRRRGARLAPLSLVAAIAAAGALARAGAEEPPLTLAVFAPNAPFASGEARYTFGSRLAAHLGGAIARRVEPKVYARASDFEAAVKRGQVDLALVDGVYLAERGVPWPVLATASTGGEASQRWLLLAREPAAIGALEGKRVAQVATSGKDAAFIDNVLLEGELPRLFGARQSVPDVASAVAAVALGKADCTFAPESAARDLMTVFDAGRLPNPALVAVKASLPRALLDGAQRAAGSYAGDKTYDGFRAPSDAYRAVAARLSSRTRKPVMAEPPLVALDPLAALTLPPLAPALPDLRGGLLAPPDPRDAPPAEPARGAEPRR